MGAGEADGRLADNVIHFVRLLRGAGLSVGPAQALGALEALQTAGIGRKQDFYWTLHATLVTRREHKPIFDQAFALFWQKRGLIDKMIALMSPEMSSAAAEAQEPKPAALRLAEALGEGAEQPPRREEQAEFDARLTMSEREVLRSKDFEQMSAAEFAEAARLVRTLVLPEDEVRTRRTRPLARGRKLDPRGTLRRTLRTGGDVIALARRTRRLRHPPLVLLIDISGSMASYSRVMLHFAHALARARERVHVFLFGTRLSNVSRHLRTRDPDEALAAVSRAVEDWSGGTRIASCLTTFNKDWSRRVLGQGAVVLLVSDGLEREAGSELPRQIERLHKSCRRLVWLNPLLRFDRFEARAGGIRAMLPHVDEFRPVHNLESLASLAAALDGRRQFLPDPRTWLRPAA
ncbi:MAG: VWA domain-containing protein [Hyphomicrobiales bacterium]|nr:VWA domain-containing protein [Hyphomicrobiales bacterium]